MKTGSALLVSILASAVTAFAVLHFANPATTTAEHHETSYERVIRTGTIRCGYEFWDSGIMQDQKTGQMSGVMVDFMDAIGKAAQLKIVWSEHVGWGTEGAALKAGKIDAECAGLWQSAAKAKEIYFSIPVAYQGFEAFVNGDDRRYDNNVDRINNEDTTIMVIDTDNSDFLAQEDFPKAKRLALGQLNGTDAELLMSVATKKADITFTVPGLWRQFDKTNPGKVRRVDPGHNLRVFGLSIATDNDDPRLMGLINVSIQEIANAGTIDKILKKYDTDYPEMYLRPAKFYRASSEP